MLPTGYAGMIVLAIVPPVWRRVMDPRVVAHFHGDVTRANLQPSKRAKLLAMYGGPVAETAPLVEEVAQRPSQDHGDPDEVLAARCPGCGHTYEVEAGNEHEGFAAGTSWTDIPDYWCCPTAASATRATSCPSIGSIGPWCERRCPYDRGVTASPQPRTMSERVVAAAAELTCEVGWSGVTMAKLADRVGVSRQTVYNEMGSKPALAEAMVLRELATFLAAVERAFDRHPDDLVEAIRAAVTDVLVEAERNAPAAGGGLVGERRRDRPAPAAHHRVRRRSCTPPTRSWPPGSRRTTSTSTPVTSTPRSTWSCEPSSRHVIHPSGSPGDVAEGIAWLADRALGAN